MTFKISLKWGKELVSLEVDTAEPISVLKMQIYSLTRVPPEGQKIMVPRVGALREDMPWSKYNLKDGVVWMLVGTAEDQQLQKPEATVFMEDIASTAVKVFKHKGGLANLGNTCYLNSSIQLLASVPELQKRLSTYRSGIEGGAEARVVSSLRQVIDDLDKRDQVIPFDFVGVFRDAFPQFAEQSEGGGYAQQDADESLSALIRCLGQVSGLEKEGSSASDLVTQLFTGSMQTTSKCIEAEDEAPESEATTFNKLSCHISSTTNFLHEGLKGGLEDHLSKYSPVLNRDAQYAKSSRIAKLPPYLCVQFVRFWWNDKAKVKAKISRPIDFPMRLDMFDYCTEQLQEKLTPIRKAIANQQLSSKTPSDTMEVESKGEDLPLTLENETGTYELKAVITHRGRVADSGHYVAWVKSANSEWLLFDDETVTPVTVEDIRLLTGSGGADWHIAYVCLYASVPKPAGLVVTEAEASSTSTSTSTSSSLSTDQ